MNLGGAVGSLHIFILLVLGQNTVSANNITRQEKIIGGGLFSIVSFPNLACKADNGLNGTCMTTSECATANGEKQGSCARGFGTCCFIRLQQCGGDVRSNRTYLQNPDFPSGTKTDVDKFCTYRFYRQSVDTCNVRLDFNVFDVGPPGTSASNEWGCIEGETDYVTVSHADGNKRSGLLLCGYNTGHHVYLDMGTESSNPGYASIQLRLDSSSWKTYARTWNILTSFIDCGTPYTPPRDCDRFFFGNYGTGIIESYNYNQPNNNYIARLNGYHRVCIRREKGSCQIAYRPPDIQENSEGFSIVGDQTSLFKSRNACRFPQPPACKSYVRIPQGSETGLTPYLFATGTTPTGRCDRFCGKRFCLNHEGCDRSDHSTIISRTLPFAIDVEFATHNPVAFINKGYILNYVQSSC